MWSTFLLLLLHLGHAVYAKDYVVKVTTSTDALAGTNAGVKIKIIGTIGTLEEAELDNDDDNFERGKTDTFTLDIADKGYVKSIQIKRDDRGALASWRLDKVVIQVSGAADSIFNYNGWVDENKWIPLSLSCETNFEINQQGYCADKDECSGSNPCKDTRATCRNTFGGFTCTCPTGYEMPNNAANENCQDINECDRQSHQCEQHCHNTIGSYSCYCDTGYRLNGPYQCDDVDECTETSPCKAPSVCVDTDGSYHCNCPDGYTKKPNTMDECEDINECDTSHICNFQTSTCQNTVGDYQCSCKSGYKNDSPKLCVDLDECAEHNNTCDYTTSTCLNDEGGYTCPCKDGYHQGSSNKICFPNQCNALNTPFQSTLSPSRCTDANANNFGDKCYMICNDGYLQSSDGTGELTCGAAGTWEGSMGICQAVKCPKLTADPNGSLYPPSCATDGASYTESCSYSCNSGYQVVGSSLRTCQDDGTWSETAPTCSQIIVAPWIICPSNIVQDLAPGQGTADVSGVWKEPTSNVPADQISIQPPEISSSYRFPYGTTEVHFTASNSAGSKSCSIFVVINDNEAPTMLTCPGNIYLITETARTINWTEPTFQDNVGVTTVESTYSSGDTFEIGSTNVKYTAKDEEGNRASCEFTVKLSRPECAQPENPDGATASCQNFGGTHFCSVVCNTGWQLYNASAAVWTCKGGAWNPTGDFPDCVEAFEKGDTPCQEGYVEMTPYLQTKLYCGKCPKGTYASLGDCSHCPAGTYNNQQGQTQCTDCPSGTTSFVGSKESSDCQEPCPAGKHSPNGLGPNCHDCPSDTYQDKTQQTSCVPCPQGTYTIAIGRASNDSCGVKPRITTIQPLSLNLQEGDSVLFSCYASGIPTPTYVWKFSSDIPPELLGQMSQSDIIDNSGKLIGAQLQLTGATERNTGSYECTVSSSHGQDAQFAQITVAAADQGSGA